MSNKEEQKVLKLFKQSPAVAYDYVWELKETARICETLWLKTCRDEGVTLTEMGKITGKTKSTIRKLLDYRSIN